MCSIQPCQTVSGVHPAPRVRNRLLPQEEAHKARGLQLRGLYAPKSLPCCPAQPNPTAGGGEAGGLLHIPADLVCREISQRSWGPAKPHCKLPPVPPPLLAISLPCRAAFVVSCLSLSQGVLKSPSSLHLQLPLTAAPPDRANSQALPSQLVFPSHTIVNHTPPIKPWSKIICELTKLKTKQALCGSDLTLAHAAALVAASPVSVNQSSFLHEAL